MKYHKDILALERNTTSRKKCALVTRKEGFTIEMTMKMYNNIMLAVLKKLILFGTVHCLQTEITLGIRGSIRIFH